MLKCNTCIHKRNIPGDAHFSCNKPSISVSGVDEIGVQRGYFMFPINFDPIWAEECTGFIDKYEDLNSISREELEKRYMFELFLLKNMVDIDFKHIHPFNCSKLMENLKKAQSALVNVKPSEQTTEQIINQINLLRKI